MGYRIAETEMLIWDGQRKPTASDWRPPYLLYVYSQGIDPTRSDILLLPYFRIASTPGQIGHFDELRIGLRQGQKQGTKLL